VSLREGISQTFEAALVYAMTEEKRTVNLRKSEKKPGGTHSSEGEDSIKRTSGGEGAGNDWRGCGKKAVLNNVNPKVSQLFGGGEPQRITKKRRNGALAGEAI